MSRELKFRVWDTFHKQWIGACAIELDGTIIDVHNAIPETNCIAQQYTGLKDKNGKEIYEGDIVKWGDLNYLVEWNDIAYKWQGRCPYYHTYHHPTTENFRDLMNGVIVGNIFENSELLK